MKTLIDFYANWCPPCKAMNPTIDSLVQELGTDRIKKIDIEEETEVAQNYGIMSIPTYVVMEDGKEITRFMGVTKKEELIKALGN